MEWCTIPLDNEIQSEIDGLSQAVSCLSADSQVGTLTGTPTLMEQAQRIMARLSGWLLDDEQKQAIEMQPWQAYFLFGCACLCDIAMTDGPDDDGSSMAKRSHDWIKRHWQQLGIKDAARADVMARACLHMQDSPDTDELPVAGKSIPFAGNLINIGLIAASISLAKALELKSATTLMEIVRHLSGDGKDPLTGSIDAFDVDDIGPHPYLPATIRVKIRCQDAELHRALKHHERTVQQRLNAFNRRVRPRFLFSDLIYEIEPDGYQPVDLKFSVDTSAALQLFMGNRLYTDKRVFLRELIQNAVDACSLRRLAETDYVPAISIAFNADISIITICDNGIGMDRQWLEKYFLSVGISFYQSDEVRSVNRDPRIDIGFISQFGIGFLSSFLVAEKIVIKTRKHAATGLMITVTSLKDYFDVRMLDDGAPTGTQVTLYLKPSTINYCRSLEFVGYLKTNIRFLQIPVRFTDERGRTTVIGNDPLSYATTHRAESDFVAPLIFADAEGFIYLGTKMNAGKIFALETASGGVSLFQDGIFVTQDDALLPQGARQHVVARINLKGRDKCELSMDRNRIFWTRAQKQAVRRQICLALAQVANRLMETLAKQGASVNTTNSIINHLSIFFDFSEVDDAVHDRLCQPLRQVVDKRFKDFVRVHFRHTRSAKGIPEADGYSERWQQGILASFAPKN